MRGNRGCVRKRRGGRRRKSEIKSRSHNELRGPLVCLPNNRRRDLAAVKTTSNNRPFFRAAEWKDDGTLTRNPPRSNGRSEPIGTDCFTISRIIDLRAD